MYFTYQYIVITIHMTKLWSLIPNHSIEIQICYHGNLTCNQHYTNAPYKTKLSEEIYNSIIYIKITNYAP